MAASKAKMAVTPTKKTPKRVDAKTKKTAVNVDAFLKNAVSGARLTDCKTLIRIMSAVTGDRPAMWGPTIVGFGSHTYVYASGRVGDWPLAAFAPRKPATVVYITRGFKRYDALMKKLGKYKLSGSCLHIKSLADVDVAVLTELIAECAAHVREKNKGN